MSEIKISVETLDNLLKRENLCIPYYQRPYSWTEKQLAPLLHDLYNRKEDELMILGGVILHEDEDSKLKIVDGQQRLVSLSIISQLINGGSGKDYTLLDHKFTNTTSIENIQNNARYVENFNIKRGNAKISFKNIHFITVTTTSREDAFSFFDSQNTRGKKLENYDILKAHHLRFIKSDGLATLCAKDWEIVEKDKNLGLGLLLETLVARGRKWANRQHDINLDVREEFKSQRKDKSSASNYALNRYQQAALFSSWKYNPSENSGLEFNFEKINASYKIGSIEVHEGFQHFFPFQITQSIEGGELFFWYTQKYHALGKEVFSKRNDQTSADFKALLYQLSLFSYNTGAVYTLDIFKGALLFYVDKFGYSNLDKIASELFYSIFWLRLKQSTIQYNSVYKYIREAFNPFALIRDASFPEYIIDYCQDFLQGKDFQVVDGTKGFRVDFYTKVFLRGKSTGTEELKLVSQNKAFNIGQLKA